MELPVGIGRRVVKADQTRHALKGHALDQCVDELAPCHFRAVLHLDQIVQRVGDREHRIVPKCIEGRFSLRVVARTSQRRARIVVAVLRPQIRVACVVRLEAARAVLAHHARQSPPALQVGVVRSRPLPIAARFHGKEPPEGVLMLIRLAGPVLERRDFAEARQPHVALTTDTHT
eukprot:5287047-Prymnesium_polylepis.1